MAAFHAPYGAPWTQGIVFGAGNIRMRLDDWDITAEIKGPSSEAVLLSLTTDNGRLIITDPVARTMEINVGWEEIEGLGAGTFRFDFVFVNKTTEQRERDPVDGSWHTLTIPKAVTFYPTEA